MTDHTAVVVTCPQCSYKLYLELLPVPDSPAAASAPTTSNTCPQCHHAFSSHRARGEGERDFVWRPCSECGCALRWQR